MLMPIFRKGRFAGFLGLAFLLCCSSLRAQVYDSLLRVLDERYPQEKIHIHFDRNYYNPGETIWFKAYLFNGLRPSELSQTLYAELYDEKGKLIERKMAPVAMSSAAAAFDLPEDIEGSAVIVRAYTRWMLNFDSSFLYEKIIPLARPVNQAAAPGPVRNRLEFFPEGGDLVLGIRSRVAFKGTGPGGMPYDVSGEIRDSKGGLVTTFRSAHDGMGVFELEPKPGEKYTAHWKDATGKSQQTPLPAALKAGLVLSVDNEPDGIRFSLTRSGQGNSVEPIQVVAQSQQRMVYMATAKVGESKTVSSTIPLELLPPGILQVTAFSADHKPLAERIIFVNNFDYEFITDLNAALKSTETRKKNVFQVDVPDTIPTNLSVSVTDAGLNPRSEWEDDIFSRILVTSDIRGYVHNPSYYFSSWADSVKAHLDLVMLTHGWRRFRWEDALAGRFPEIKYQPEEYLTLEGQITGLTPTQLHQRELTGFLEVDNKQQFISIPVSPSGKFSIPGLLFFDTAKLYYQFNNDKDKILTSLATFDIKNSFLRHPLRIPVDTALVRYARLPGRDALLHNEKLFARSRELMEARRKIQTLEAVTVTARTKSKKELMDEQYTSGLFSGGDAYTFIMEDDPASQGAMSVLNYLQGRVAGLQISGYGQQMSLSWRGSSPSLFLNEIISDVSMIQTLSMADVAMIKVFQPPFFGAPGGGSGGAIAVYTKKGVSANSDVKGLDFAAVPGYSPVREFYSPDYSRYDERHSEEDYRPTLYWQPFLLTDKDRRRVLFTFYNNDITRKFRIVIEGCDAEGKLTRIEKVFE